MSGSIVRRHLHKSFELVGVFASAAAYLAFLNKQSAEEGMTYYDTTLNQLRTHDGTTFSPAGQNGVSAGSLDDAANIGTKITIDGALSSGIEIEATDTFITSGALLLLDNDDTGSDIHSLEIAQVSTASAIQITNTTATTDDIQGTSDSWAVTGQGLATFDKGVEILGDTSAATLKLGASSDITISYTDSGTPGTVGAGLMFTANTSADQIQIGDSTRAIDVWFEGSADTNYMLWDASANLLILNGSDLRLEDDDILGFGDADDVTITWNDSTPALEIEALVQDTGQIRIGSGNAIDLAVYGETATDIALFDVSGPILEMNGWDIRLKDDDILEFGDASGGDVFMRWDQADFDILAAADDTVIKIGNGTNSFDIWIYGETANDNIIFNASDNKLSFDGIDLKLEDDDYILLGTSATAGSSTDGTIRWDATNSVLEIIGNTTFEGATVIVDNDLTVSGVLTLSGSLNPSALTLGDGETLTFGDGSDLVMSATGTTMTIDIKSSSSLDITGTGGNEMIIGEAANLVNLTLSGTLKIGTDDKGYDVSFFAENGSDLVLWDQNAVSNVGAFIFTGSCAYFTDSAGVGDTALLLGTGAGSDGDFSIRGDSSVVLHIDQVSSGNGTMEIGADGKGITTTFFGETASAFMKWVQASDQLQLEGATSTASLALGDGDQILLGDTLGTGDFVISATSNVLTIDQVDTGTQSTIEIGANNDGMDITIFGDTAGSKVKWTTASDSLIFTDAPIVFDGNAVDYTLTTSTDTLVVTATDGSAAKVTWGDNGTNGLDQEWLSVSAGNLLNWDAGTETLKFTDCLCTMTGADNRGTILAIVGNDANGNSDTVTINAEGTGVALKITADDVDSIQQSIICKTAQTSSMLVIDGTTTAGWTGATGVGMLNITNDSIAVVADGTMVNILKTGNLAAANDGVCLEIEETGAAQGTTYAVRIASTSNEALHVDTGKVQVDEIVTTGIGYQSTVITKIAHNNGASGSTIDPGTRVVHVTGFNANADDWILLPSGTIGERLTIISDVAHEIRTPASSNDTINDVDADGGTNEYAVVLDDINDFICTGTGASWIAVAHDKLGAAKTIAPDTV